MTFRKNKEQYHQRYHLGFFEDDYEKLGLGVFEDNDALLRGKLVHRMMERFPDNDLDNLFSELDISDDQLISKLRGELREFRDKIAYSQAIAPVLRAKNFKNEISIMRALGDDFLTGTLDRIYKNEDDQWVIVDYKSNKITKSEVRQTAERYEIQMEIYALLLAALYPAQKSFQVGLYFITADELVVRIYSEQQIKSFEKKYMKVISEIKAYYPYTDKLYQLIFLLMQKGNVPSKEDRKTTSGYFRCIKLHGTPGRGTSIDSVPTNDACQLFFMNS